MTGSAEDGLPPLREVIAAHGLAAKKALGQNFLFDLNLTRKIARSAAPLNTSTIIEIGPGPGGLTRALLAEGATDVLAIERDARAIPALEQVAAAYPGRLRIIHGDALEQDWASLVTGKAKIVANLPYNIATPLLIGWISENIKQQRFDSMTLMFQKEVAMRIVAAAGSSDYGRLSILCQWACETRKLFDVNRASFTPPPKVTSSVVQLIPRSARTPDCALHDLERVTAAAFGQRRKMLRSSLASVFPDTEKTLSAHNINPELRAEQLPMQKFVELAQLLA
jgi:16S rRNA (adenine1518-N6/adenine1519-N6)-dimethyltransferase